MKYQAICTKQVKDGKQVVYFSAPAPDIDLWAGVPQKKGSADETDTTGFQRDENATRINSIVAFLKDPKNVIQNPLLCATQSKLCGSVVFTPDARQPEGGQTLTGSVTIEVDDFSRSSLLELMRKVKQQLESRVPELAEASVDAVLVNQIKSRSNIGDFVPSQADTEDEQQETEDIESDDSEVETTQESTEVVFSDESHILDFWRELTARVQIIEELGQAFTGDQFEGFSREAMMSFLKPVVVMDGQHRLTGKALPSISTPAKLVYSSRERMRFESSTVH